MSAPSAESPFSGNSAKTPLASLPTYSEPSLTFSAILSANEAGEEPFTVMAYSLILPSAPTVISTVNAPARE